MAEGERSVASSVVGLGVGLVKVEGGIGIGDCRSEVFETKVGKGSVGVVDWI